VLSRHREVRVNVRTIPDLLTAQLGDELMSNVIYAPQSRGREKDLPADQPGPGIDHKSADEPSCIIKENIADCADKAIARVNRVAIYL
jgi:hypothetical protein